MWPSVAPLYPVGNELLPKYVDEIISIFLNCGCPENSVVPTGPFNFTLFYEPELYKSIPVVP